MIETSFIIYTLISSWPFYIQLYFFERKIEKTQTNLQTPPTQAKRHWNGVVKKKKLLDGSMIFPGPKKAAVLSSGNGLLQQKKRPTKQLHPNRSRMNWPRLKLLLRHESGTKKRQAQRFLPRKLDSSVFPQFWLSWRSRTKNPTLRSNESSTEIGWPFKDHRFFW